MPCTTHRRGNDWHAGVGQLFLPTTAGGSSTARATVTTPTLPSTTFAATVSTAVAPTAFAPTIATVAFAEPTIAAIRPAAASSLAATTARSSFIDRRGHDVIFRW